MCVCEYVYIYIYMCVCVCVFVFTCMYAWLGSSLRWLTNSSMYTLIRISASALSHSCIYDAHNTRPHTHTHTHRSRPAEQVDPKDIDLRPFLAQRTHTHILTHAFMHYIFGQCE